MACCASTVDETSEIVHCMWEDMLALAFNLSDMHEHDAEALQSSASIMRAHVNYLCSDLQVVWWRNSSILNPADNFLATNMRGFSKRFAVQLMIVEPLFKTFIRGIPQMYTFYGFCYLELCTLLFALTSPAYEFLGVTDSITNTLLMLQHWCRDSNLHGRRKRLDTHGNICSNMLWYLWAWCVVHSVFPISLNCSPVYSVQHSSQPSWPSPHFEKPIQDNLHIKIQPKTILSWTQTVLFWFWCSLSFLNWWWYTKFGWTDLGSLVMWGWHLCLRKQDCPLDQPQERRKHWWLQCSYVVVHVLGKECGKAW